MEYTSDKEQHGMLQNHTYEFGTLQWYLVSKMLQRVTSLITSSKLELKATLGKTTKIISTVGNGFMDATSWVFG
jgi:hypothetical protein